MKNEKVLVGILAAVQFAHILDFVIMMPLGPILMRNFSITPAEFGLLVSSYNFSAALMSFVTGLIADRFDRKNFLLVSFIGFILGTYLCSVSDSFTFFILARIIAGAFGGIINSVIYSICTDLIPTDRRGAALGTIMMSFSIASVIGVPIGLWFATTYSWKAPFVFIAILSVIIWALVLYIVPNVREHIQKDASPKELLSSYWKVIKNPEYLTGFFFIILLSMSVFVMIPFIATYNVHNVGILETELSYVYLVGGFFTMFTSRIIGKLTDRFSSKKVFFVLGPLSFIPILLYTNLPPSPLWKVLVYSTFFMTIVSGRMVACMKMITMIPSTQERGAFMSVQNSFRSLGTATAAFLGGIMVTQASDGKLIGYNRTGFFAIILTSICLYLAYIIDKRLAIRKTST